MDEDLDELIAQLCTWLGIIMEDASAIALGVMGLQGQDRRAAISELTIAATRIDALSKALGALTG